MSNTPYRQRPVAPDEPEAEVRRKYAQLRAAIIGMLIAIAASLLWAWLRW
jgi:hypothetical protein